MAATRRPAGGGVRARQSREFEVRNENGLHARPAAMLAKTASRFDCDIEVEKGGNRVSGKSIMGLMTLAAARGSRLRVTANGVDAQTALDEIEKLFAGKFTVPGAAADD